MGQWKVEMERHKQIQELFRKWTGQDLLVDWVWRGGHLGGENSEGWILSFLWILNGKCSGGLAVFLLEVLTFAATTPKVIQSQVLSWLHFLLSGKLWGGWERETSHSACVRAACVSPREEISLNPPKDVYLLYNKAKVLSAPSKTQPFWPYLTL